MTQSQEKLVSILLGATLILSVLVVAKEASVYVTKRVESASVIKKAEMPCIVIDAGHGGNDPGKVGINNALEKDVNLEIAQILKSFLEANDVRVVMTREDDMGLYDESASNKKVQDMKRRLSLIEECAPTLVVSIHQNSYHEEYVSGAQVFYYADSAEGEKLAEKIQAMMIKILAPEKERQVKPNDSYYLLKKTKTPIVIVECGFLSNSREAAKLVMPRYQERVAWAIHLAIMQYLNEKK